MNQTIETYLNHRSIRNYLDKEIPNDILDAIIASAQAAPTSINGQQLSVIVVKNPETKKALSVASGDQAWIDQAPVFLVFVADYHKAKLAAEKNGLPLVITQDIESLMVASVDVGIAMGNAIGAAESLDLGIVPIGGVRRNPQAVIDILGLPEFVFPVAGLVVGYPAETSEKKPRLPLDTFAHQEKYNPELSTHIDAYDDIVSKYMLERTNGQSDRNWSSSVSGLYQSVYYPKVSPVSKSQGFEGK